MNLAYEKISADRFTPLVVFKKLKARALLESAVLEIGKSRHSIIMIEETYRIALQNGQVIKQEDGDTRVLSEDPHDYLDIISQQKYQGEQQGLEHIPIPLNGLGYLGYETVAFFDEINLSAQQDDYQIPDAVFMFGKTFAIFDHYKDEIYLVAVDRSEQSPKDLQEKVLNVKERLLDNDFRAYDVDEKDYPCQAGIDLDKQKFIEGVEKIKQEIIKGNLLQGVLSRKISAKTRIPTIEAYRRLRRENPSPYLFYLDFDGFVLFGSSPEVMVQLKGSTASLKPIAGTRPRGVSKQKDLDLESELLADPKERAEHLMLIDLARNDLGRVSRSGTVKTVSEYIVERYSHVMHIVSEVESEILDDKNTQDLIKATFPAGTVSGAPKIKAIEVISELESKKRGPYAGLVGYFDKSGDFDSCIAIRSVLVKDGTYYIQSGAGIVYDSIPENEYQETVNKAKAVLRSIGLDTEQGDQR